MLHPVGRLPARVYWRRRLIVLAVLLGLLAGAGWLVIRLVDPPGEGSTAAGGAPSGRPVPTPALEQVLPSLVSVRTPDAQESSAEPRRTAANRTPAPTPGGPCTDDMIELTMQAPVQVPAGSTPTLEIVVRNVSDVACVRRLDGELREVVLVDSDGDRRWGSNDCRPEPSDTRATLEPGKGVALEIVWSGRTSEPGCAAERTVPEAGVYVLRGRLDTKTTPERRIRLVQL